MADQPVRDDIPGNPKLGQGVLESEENRLCVPGQPDLFLGRGEVGGRGENDFAEIKTQVRRGQFGAIIKPLLENRLGAIKFAGHVAILRALAGEEEGDGIGVGFATRYHAGRVGQVGELQRLGVVARDEHAAVRKLGAADVQGVGDVGEMILPRVTQMSGKTTRGVLQRGRRLGRKCQQAHRATGPRGRGSGRFFQDDVRIRTADAEGSDRGAARMAAGFPIGEPVDDLDPGIGVDERIELLEMQRGRNLLPRQRHGGLEQTRHAGSGVEVADVGLDRADLQFVRAIAVSLAKRAQLDRVADRRARPVRLHIIDGGGGNSGGRQRLGDHFRLALDTRREEADFAAAVIVDGAALDHGVDGVASLDGVAEPAQDHEAETAPKNRSGRAGVKGAAMAVLRLDFVLAIRVADGMGNLDADRAGEGHVAAELEQALAGEMDRDERGRARGLDVDARPLEIHLVGGARGEDILVISGVAQEKDAFPLDEIGIAQEVVDEIGIRPRPGEDAGRALKCAWSVPGVFQRFPRTFQEKALLRVHDGRLARADSEKSGIECVELRQRRTGSHIIGILEQRLAHADRFEILDGKLADRLDAVHQVFPELGGVISAGKARGETDDRDVRAGSLACSVAHEEPRVGGVFRGRACRARDCRRSLPRNLPLLVFSSRAAPD